MAQEVKKYLDLEGLQYLITKLLAGGIKGKGLSTNDLTDALLTKINGTATSEGLADLTTRLEALETHFGTDTDKVINKFQEIVAFLAGVESTETLEGMMADIATQIADAKKAGTDAAAALNTYKTSNDAAVAKKVDKVSGKGLSTNDYTAADKKLVATISDKLDAADLSAIATTEIDALISA